MTLYAYDGAAPFSLTAAKAHGAIAITGYLVGKPGGFDPIDKARVDAIRQMGMGFSPNWERMADYFLTQSVAACRTAGVEALNACRALGVPDDGTVRCSFSIDTQVPSSRFGEMGDKLKAAEAGLAGAYQTMLYGQSDLIDWLCAQGYLTGKHWLMASTWDAPYNTTSPNVCAIQSHDPAGNWLDTPVTGTDINTVTDPHGLGAWWPDDSPYGGDDMPLSDTDLAKIQQVVHDQTVAVCLRSDEVKAMISGQVQDTLRDNLNKGNYAFNCVVQAVQQAVDAKGVTAAAGVITADGGVSDRVAQVEKALTALPSQVAAALPAGSDTAAIEAAVASALGKLTAKLTGTITGGVA